MVTGAGTGLGQQFAVTLAQAGADVVLAARRQDKLAETAAMIDAIDGRRSVCVAMDVTDRVNRCRMASSGDRRAGYTDDCHQQCRYLERGIRDRFYAGRRLDAVIDTNLNGVFWVAQAAGKAMIAGTGSGGSIVNIASILGRRVSYMLSAYSAAKAGVIKLTESLALEWVRQGIRVNAIAPGFFVTDINREFFATPNSEKLVKGIPMRRPGELHELSGALMLLASDAGAYMTGSTITVDGGHTCNPL